MDRSGYKDLAWYTERGTEFAAEDWHDGGRKSLSYCVYGGGHFVLAVFNANFNDMDWKLPPLPEKWEWSLLLDSSEKFSGKAKLASGNIIRVPAWSVLVFDIKK